MELNFNLHPAQLEIFNSKKRFIVVSAGRRFGKSYVSAVKLITEALKTHNEHGYELSNKDVFYVAPTFPQGKDIMWRLVKNLGRKVIKSTVENTGVITLVNDRKIHIKGSDRPDTLRGIGLSYVVLDEYASMKPVTWEQILRPTLSDVRGGALFIGTPAGKNHFYELYKQAEEDPEFEAFSFTSKDNPFLDPNEIEAAKRIMGRDAFRQEYEASFQAGSSTLFSNKDIIFTEEPEEGEYYLAVDPAGYADMADTPLQSKLRRLDETAIAVVKVGKHGWWVKDIIHGRWDIRETSIKILRESQKVHSLAIGIEKGSLKNAIMPYLSDQMRRLSVFPKIVEVSHGNKNKTDRIVWSLQGRLQHGKIKFNKESYINTFIDQLMDFPNPQAHDDMLDALSYIDQVAKTVYFTDIEIDNWEPLDMVAGY